MSTGVAQAQTLNGISYKQLLTENRTPDILRKCLIPNTVRSGHRILLHWEIENGVQTLCKAPKVSTLFEV